MVVAMGLLLLPSCSTLEREMQPVTDSLHSPAMNSAIEEARRVKSATPG